MNGHQLPLLQREVIVRTPENIELRYELCGAGSRAAAYLIDVLLMVCVGQLLVSFIAYFIMILVQTFSLASESWAAAAAGLLAFALYNGYFVFFEWLLNGQTPGKRLLHVRVIKEGGYALRFVDTLLRNLLRTIDFIPAFYGVGLVSLLLTRHCQRLGDLVAGTLVVRQQPMEKQFLLTEWTAPSETESSLPAAQLTAVPADLVSLVHQFLGRRAELAPRFRQEFAAEFVDLIRHTSGLEPQSAQSNENFLVAVLTQGEQLALVPPPLTP